MNIRLTLREVLFFVFNFYWLESFEAPCHSSSTELLKAWVNSLSPSVEVLYTSLIRDEWYGSDLARYGYQQRLDDWMQHVGTVRCSLGMCSHIKLGSEKRMPSWVVFFSQKIGRELVNVTLDYVCVTFETIECLIVMGSHAGYCKWWKTADSRESDHKVILCPSFFFL